MSRKEIGVPELLRFTSTQTPCALEEINSVGIACKIQGFSVDI